MGQKPTVKSLTAGKYDAEYPNAPTLTLAKKMYAENKSVFTNLEDARSSIRYCRGQSGDKKRKERSSAAGENIDRRTFNYNPFKIPKSEDEEWALYKMPKGDYKTLILSDIHLPYHSEKALDLSINYGLKNDCKTLFINGDLFDAYSLSRFEKDPRKRHFAAELEMTRDFLKECKKHFEHVYYKLGNHCFDDQTEILTKAGWKNNNEISYEDDFATLNTSSNSIQFQKAEKIHNLPYKGEMIGVKSQRIDMLVTPDHRVYLKYGSSKKDTTYQIQKASEIRDVSRVYFRVSGTENNIEYKNITDDEIRLCAWIYTDGSVLKKENQKPQYSIWQRKGKVHLVTTILNSLNYEYSVKERESKTTEICGKVLKKKPDYACHVFLRRGRFGRNSSANNHRLDELISDKYILSDWAYKLSDRQFDIFLSSLIDGDGSRHIKNPNTSWMLYGVKPFLDQVQAICVTHGYRTSISEYRKGTYRLNIFKKDEICIDKFKKSKFTQEYDGNVFCVTVPNGTVIVRRNGKVHVSGNCERFEKYMRIKAPELLSIPEFELSSVLHQGSIGFHMIDEKRIVRLGYLNILHGHEFYGGTSQAVNPARGVYLKTAESCITGHLHKSSSHTDTSLTGKITTTWSTGCLCGLHPDYARINKWNHGFAVVESYKDGTYHVHNKTIYDGKVL